MSALKAFLEDFERPPAPAPASAASATADDGRIKAVASDAYAEGYAAGQAAAASQTNANHQALDNAAVQLNAAFADLSSQVRVQFCDALKAAIEKVFPVLAEKGFAETCAAAVADAAGLDETAAAGARVTIRTAPSQAEPLQAAFSRLNLENAVRITADAALSETEVKADWDSAGIELDVDAAIRQSLDALEHTIAQLNHRM